MSPFLVYLMMQADSITNALVVISIITGCLFVFGIAIYVITKGCADHDAEAESVNRAIASPLKYVSIVFGISMLMDALMPSTKTIALMVVLPKVTSPQAIDAMGSEAKDVYLLAKDALRTLAKDGSDKKDEKAK